jgi:hypothetical protein
MRDRSKCSAAVVVAASLTCAAVSAVAQPANRYGASAEGAPSNRYFSEVSYVAPSPLSFGSTEYGDVDTLASQVSYQSMIRHSDSWSWIVGFDLQGTWFDVPGRAPIPDALYETSLRLGGSWRINEKWSLQAMLSPGLYSDFEDIDGGDFNMPGLVLAFWQVTERLQLIAGAGVNARRDVPVIPAIGGRWQFADDWTLLAVFPTPRIEYAASEAVTVFAGAELVRSAYRVAEDFGDRFGRPELNGEDISYNEWRVGAGARWKISRALVLSLDGGWMGDREYNFDDQEFKLESDGAPYVQFGVSGTY